MKWSDPANRPDFLFEHGLQYGQDRPCRYFSNDVNLTARIRSPPQPYFRCSSLSRHSHGLPIVGARPIGSAIWRRMRCTLQRTASDIGRRQARCRAYAQS
jgi:hypothetical protein